MIIFLNFQVFLLRLYQTSYLSVLALLLFLFKNAIKNIKIELLVFDLIEICFALKFMLEIGILTKLQHTFKEYHQKRKEVSKEDDEVF